MNAKSSSTWGEYFPPRPEWSVDEISDQTGKVYLITGGTSGLGVFSHLLSYCMS